jgi:hypothetical protein
MSLQELYKEASIKNLDRMGSLGTFIKNWAVPALAVAGTTGVIKETYVDPAIQAGQIEKSYRQLKSKTPQLKEVDSKTMKDYFKVVKDFSPKAAANPLVAGALVNKMVQFGGVDHKLVQDIVNIQSSLAAPSITRSAIDTSVKALSQQG